MTTKKKKYRLFPTKFPVLLEDWKRQQKENGKPGSNYEFGKQVGVPNYRVSDFKSCRQGIPYSYIDKICEVLGVSPDVFEPTTDEEKYENDSQFITDLGKAHVNFAKSEGLDLNLVQALSNVVDFDSLFPIYLPIPDREDCVLTKKRILADSAPIDNSLQYLQVHRDDKTITFHKCDLAYLKEVQDQVIEFVSYLFYKRSMEMKKEALLFNDDFREIHPDHGPVKTYETGSDFLEDWNRRIDRNGVSITISHKSLEEEVMEICQKHDRFMPLYVEHPSKSKEAHKNVHRFYDGSISLGSTGVPGTKNGGNDNGTNQRKKW